MLVSVPDRPIRMARRTPLFEKNISREVDNIEKRSVVKSVTNDKEVKEVNISYPFDVPASLPGGKCARHGPKPYERKIPPSLAENSVLCHSAQLGTASLPLKPTQAPPLNEFFLLLLLFAKEDMKK